MPNIKESNNNTGNHLDLENLRLEEFREILQVAEKKSDARLREVGKLIAEKQVYLYGFGGKGRALAQHISKAGNCALTVYDSRAETREAARREDFQVIDDIGTIDINKSCVILGACQAQAEQASIIKKNHIYFQEAAYYFDSPHLANSSREFRSYILENVETLYSKYKIIHIKSRGSFVSVLRFRISLDPNDLLPYKKNNAEMWFDILESQSNKKYSTFLDIGAFDGDTLRFALDRLSITRGIAVEANPELIESIKSVSTHFPDGVLILPHAAWSHDCHLSFSEVRNGMIQVSESPDGEIAAAPLDEHIHENIDLIKMDIEGAEIRALAGCRKTIVKYHPDLTIAAYHRPDDLVAIIDFIDTNIDGAKPYDIHVRHYSDCIDDTILYFLENSGEDK
ncbi:MAG: FkbM family methyltransferase [Azonexus sp.]